MATKRHHNKSRLGCDRCRLRRVKCDEKEPSCTNCSNRREQCLYVRRNAFSASSRKSPVTRAADSPTPPALLGGDAASREATSLRELRLMHHWCLYTSQGFSPEVTDVFRNHVTLEAFRYQYLMESIFAICALRIAVEAAEADDVETSRTHIAEALHYQNRCLAGLQDALQNLTQTNCSAVLCSTMAMMICAVVSPLVPAAPNDDCESTVEALLTEDDRQHLREHCAHGRRRGKRRCRCEGQ